MAGHSKSSNLYIHSKTHILQCNPWTTTCFSIFPMLKNVIFNKPWTIIVLFHMTKCCKRISWIDWLFIVKRHTISGKIPGSGWDDSRTQHRRVFPRGNGHQEIRRRWIFVRLIFVTWNKKVLKCVQFYDLYWYISIHGPISLYFDLAIS